MEFRPGCIKDTVDERDFLYEEKVGAGEPFDWSKGYDIEEEMGVKLFVVFLDGACPRFVNPLLQMVRLPALASLKARGAGGTLKSTLPPSPAPAWMLTWCP